jgi:hypothetical protein
MSETTENIGTIQNTQSNKQREKQGTSQSQSQKVGINFALKAKYALYTTLIFFLIANPETYKLMQKFIGGWVMVANDGGCPTPTGFFLHTGLFFAVLWSFMLLPRDF